MKVSDSYLKKTCSLWSNSLTYDEVSKAEAHRHASRCLKVLAERIGYTKPIVWKVRSNKAGPAVSGEVTLHGDPLVPNSRGIYVQIGQMWPFSSDGKCRGSIMYRTCNHIADYRGHSNNWILLEDAFGNNNALDAFAQLCKGMML